MTFDSNGNLLPHGVTSKTLTECKSLLVDSFPTSTTRLTNWNNFLQYRADLIKLIGGEIQQWVDGSFCTHKENPNDIDVVSFIDSDKFVNEIRFFDMNFSHGYPKTAYNIDGYIVPIFPEGDTRRHITVDRVNYWTKWFGHDRQENPKGIVEITC